MGRESAAPEVGHNKRFWTSLVIPALAGLLGAFAGAWASYEGAADAAAREIAANSKAEQRALRASTYQHFLDEIDLAATWMKLISHCKDPAAAPNAAEVLIWVSNGNCQYYNDSYRTKESAMLTVIREVRTHGDREAYDLAREIHATVFVSDDVFRRGVAERLKTYSDQRIRFEALMCRQTAVVESPNC